MLQELRAVLDANPRTAGGYGWALLALLLLGPGSMIFGLIRGKDPADLPRELPDRLALAGVPLTGVYSTRLTIAILALALISATLGVTGTSPDTVSRLAARIQEIRAAYPGQAELNLRKVTPFLTTDSTLQDRTHALSADKLGLVVFRAEKDDGTAIEIFADADEAAKLPEELPGRASPFFACAKPGCTKYFTVAAMARLEQAQRNPAAFLAAGVSGFPTALGLFAIILFGSSGIGLVGYFQYVFQLKKRAALRRRLPTLTATSGPRATLTPSFEGKWRSHPLARFFGFHLRYRGTDSHGNPVSLRYRPPGETAEDFQGILVKLLPVPYGRAFIPDSLLRELRPRDAL